MIQPAPAPRPVFSRVSKVLAAGSLLACAGVVVQNSRHLQHAEEVRVRQANELSTQLENLRGELSSIRGELAGAFEEKQKAEALATRLDTTEQNVDRIGAAIEASSESERAKSVKEAIPERSRPSAASAQESRRARIARPCRSLEAE